MSQSNLVSSVAPPVPSSPPINPPDLRTPHQYSVRPSEGTKQSEDDQFHPGVNDEALHVPAELPAGLAASDPDDSRKLLSDQDSDQCSS